MSIIKKLLELLTPQERNRFVLLVLMVLIMAFLDVLGVASVLPFITVLMSPDLVEKNFILNNLYNKLGFVNLKSFFFVLGVIVFFFFLLSVIFKAFTTHLQIRFALNREYSMSKRLFESYLSQPYIWFLNQHSADLSKKILSEVNIVINKGLIPLMNLITQSAVTIVMLLLLFIVNPLLTLSVGFILIIVYFIIYIILFKWVRRLGKTRKQADKECFIRLSETYGAIKEIKVGGLEQSFIENFLMPLKTYTKSKTTFQSISILPRYFMEFFFFGGALLVALLLMSQDTISEDIIPTIALFVIASYRLIPAMQQIYSSSANLRFVKPAIDELNKEYFRYINFTPKYENSIKSMPLKHSIKLNNITYSYPNVSKPAVKYINLSIPAHSIVGFVGTTGSGKTTIIDLILGLLEPQEGTLCIDGKEINASNRRQWQSGIGYVPQHIYLADSTIAQNIAFGVSPENINLDDIKEAATIANINEFIVNELPKQYQTTIGERGVRLSGGQRQRIGIARALYHKPKIIIFDEATSALDEQTEKTVMDAINKISKNTTIIIVAHRLNTIKKCDIIFKIEKGKIINQENFNEIINDKV
jgi:ABC-type multidrug transport system fused ATPase/permease subunit